ncbi:MAG: hypothetical protein K8H89_01310 [Flavobacteriales bacterium]|nr:hypothetical protein [Flavobacteriales bacterium]
MEHNRIAKDLHHRLGSKLSAIRHQFRALEVCADALNVEQSAQFNKVNRLLDDAVEEVRRISHDMIKGALAEFGLGHALQDLRDSIAIKGRLDVELNIFGSDQRMERSTEIAVHHIVQELVANALKHAHPSEISIAPTRMPERFSITVSDNGAGFYPAGRKDGMGVDNVRSRTGKAGGTMLVDSTVNRCTTVSIEVPIA